MAFLRTIAGFALLVLGAILALPLPEVGVPLLLVGLRLLGERYAWARRANRWVDAQWSALKRWFHSLPVASKAIVLLLLVGVAVAAAWLTIAHL